MFTLPHKMKFNCIRQYSNKILFLMQLIDVVAVLVKEIHRVSSSTTVVQQQRQGSCVQIYSVIIECGVS